MRQSDAARDRRAEHIDAMVALRPLVFARDGYRCARCGCDYTARTLQVHHRLMRSQGGPDTMENLITLCGPNPSGCHGWVHLHPVESYESGLLIRFADGAPDRAWGEHGGMTLPSAATFGTDAEYDGRRPQHSGCEDEGEQHDPVFPDWS